MLRPCWLPNESILTSAELIGFVPTASSHIPRSPADEATCASSLHVWSASRSESYCLFSVKSCSSNADVLYIYTWSDVLLTRVVFWCRHKAMDLFTGGCSFPTRASRSMEELSLEHGPLCHQQPEDPTTSLFPSRWEQLNIVKYRFFLIHIHSEYLKTYQYSFSIVSIHWY